MALTWDVSRCKDWEKHPAVTTQALVFLSMVCGFNEITEKNAKEVAVRCMAWEAAHGPMRASDKAKLFITAEEVNDHLGLRTNSGVRSKTQFQRALGASLYEQALRKARVTL